MSLNMKANKKIPLIAATIQIIRDFPKMDQEFLQNKGFVSLRPLVSFEHFDFSRSFEYVKDFTCSMNTGKNLLAALINRQLHVYDYVHDKILFKTNISGIEESNTAKQIFFTESDQVVVVKSGLRSLTLVSVT